ncbi:hypothetical protein G6F70_002657 [Rhizopus microsporus]|uniref:BLOC-1-related complex subunit 5 n=1 Tax=Rhizopus microsporus TaxID=58291 RepID=A0A1X0RU23_RHIZD|nr:hypothetical protein G6F71_007091 [Rhizopus microsporus]KAG1202005.1 hypothetical protein G6F70_002657 [Rhizopus microsporus]KAG1213124.1 hypothetical protein G6F69_003101 [Rhizopus microsporus]KAG1229967.1 hypothetical protein G6F67_006788 [Rhizopus microsporus]KAG1261948.1 hypothetical protein G6F68_006304 [Rhizopus microsporus]
MTSISSKEEPCLTKASHSEETDSSDNNLLLTETQTEDGVIEVVHRLEEAEDSDLKRLKEIGKVEPLVKIQEKGFTLESVLSLKSSGKLVTNKHIGKYSADSLADTLFDIQDHIAAQMSQVNSDQRLLLQRIKHVDDLSSSMAQSSILALNQSKLICEKIPEVNAIKQQANCINQQISTIFRSLSSIEKYLDTEDRITNLERWPLLGELYLNALKKTSPSIERLIKSNASEPSTTAESILQEEIIATGQSVVEKDEEAIDRIANTTQATGSSFTSSLALSRLRGLSSMSINKYAQ